MQSFILIAFLLAVLCHFVHAIHLFDNQEKNWLDRCDLLRLQSENAEITTPKPKRPTKKPKPPEGPNSESEVGRAWRKHWSLRPLAPREELLDIMKEKLILDARSRGGPVEIEEDWSKDTRSFISEFYDDYHSGYDEEHHYYLSSDNENTDYNY